MPKKVPEKYHAIEDVELKCLTWRECVLCIINDDETVIAAVIGDRQRQRRCFAAKRHLATKQ